MNAFRILPYFHNDTDSTKQEYNIFENIVINENVFWYFIIKLKYFIISNIINIF